MHGLKSVRILNINTHLIHSLLVAIFTIPFIAHVQNSYPGVHIFADYLFFGLFLLAVSLLYFKGQTMQIATFLTSPSSICRQRNTRYDAKSAACLLDTEQDSFEDAAMRSPKALRGTTSK